MNVVVWGVGREVYTYEVNGKGGEVGCEKRVCVCVCV